jgi:tripartite ATP-independent transporter DctP family solute receptor
MMTPSRRSRSRAARLALLVFAVCLSCGLLPSQPVLARALVMQIRLSGASISTAGGLMLVEEMNRRLPGRIDFDLRPSAVYGNEKQTLNDIVNGIYDVELTSSGTVSSLIPELGLFDVPFLFRDQGHAQRVLEGPVGQAFIAKLREHGLVVLGWGEEGFRDITTSAKPVQRPQDLAGLKIRVQPNVIYELTFKTLGATATPLAISDLYDALRTGRLDGEDNPTSQILSNSLADVQTYLSLSEHFYVSTLVLINRASFDRLDAEEQAALLAAGKAVADFTRKRSAENHAKELETLRGKGMKIIDTLDRDAFVKALAPAYEEFGKRFGADMLTRIRETP